MLVSDSVAAQNCSPEGMQPGERLQSSAFVMTLQGVGFPEQVLFEHPDARAVRRKAMAARRSIQTR